MLLTINIVLLGKSPRRSKPFAGHAELPWGFFVPAPRLPSGGPSAGAGGRIPLREAGAARAPVLSSGCGRAWGAPGVRVRAPSLSPWALAPRRTVSFSRWWLRVV